MKQLIVFFAIATLVASAVAQGGGGRGQGGGGRQGFGGRGGFGMQNDLQVLSRSDVQADKILALKEEQKKAIADAQQAMREEMQGMFQGGGGQIDREAMQKAFEEMNKKSQEKVDKILDANQKVRLGQIKLWISGVRAVTQPEVQKQLGLTQAQIDQIKALQTKQQEANTNLMQQMRDGSIDREQLMELRQKNEKVFEDEINKVLTDANKTKLTELKGPEFKVEAQQGRQRPPAA